MLPVPQILSFDDIQLRSVAFSYDGKYIVCSTDTWSGKGAIWEVGTGILQGTFTEKHSGDITVSPIAYCFVSASGIIRKLPSGEIIRKIPGYPLSDFSSDGTVLAIVNRRMSLYRMAEPDAGLFRHLRRPRDGRELSVLRFLTGDRYLTGFGYTYDQTDRFYLWDMQGEDRPLVFRKDRYCDHIFSSPTGHLTTTTNNNVALDSPTLVRFWSPIQDPAGTVIGWKKIERCDGHTQFTKWASYSPNGAIFVAIGANRIHPSLYAMPEYQLSLWSLPDLTRRDIPIEGECYCFTISPDSRLIASMTGNPTGLRQDDSPDYKLTIWNLRTGVEIASMQTPRRQTKLHSPVQMHFSPDGNHLAVRHGCHIVVWDTQGI